MTLLRIFPSPLAGEGGLRPEGGCLIIKYPSAFLSGNILADTKNELADTIPFIAYKAPITYYVVPVGDFSVRHKKNRSHSYASDIVSEAPHEILIGNPSVADVQHLIKRVRTAVCDATEESDVRVWVSFDASGKLLGVGASAQSGLEVTFHCKRTNN